MLGVCLQLMGKADYETVEHTPVFNGYLDLVLHFPNGNS